MEFQLLKIEQLEEFQRNKMEEDQIQENMDLLVNLNWETIFYFQVVKVMIQ